MTPKKSLRLVFISISKSRDYINSHSQYEDQLFNFNSEQNEVEFVGLTNFSLFDFLLSKASYVRWVMHLTRQKRKKKRKKIITLNYNCTNRTNHVPHTHFGWARLLPTVAKT